MSGVFPTYLAALQAGHRGWIEYGWSFVCHDHVTCYFWNPDPDWEGTPEPPIDDEIKGEKDFSDYEPPWLEHSEAWDEALPFRDPIVLSEN